MLRDYQVAALDAVRSRFSQGVSRQLMVIPTGGGKTVVFAQLSEHLRDILPGQMLVIVHLNELVWQAVEKLHRWNPGLTIDVEKAEKHADLKADIVVASVPTLGRANSKRAERFDWDNFSICVVDEAHHATADSYRRILELGGFLSNPLENLGKRKLLLGVTATSERGDGTPLKDIFQEVVYDYPMFKAMDDGWLCALRAFTVKGGSNLDSVRTRAGDFAEDELANEVNTPKRNECIVKAWKENGSPQPALAFTVNVQHAKDLAKTFQNYAIVAEHVSGNDPARAEKIQAFRDGKIPVLTNCALLGEGFDCWSIQSVILARPTKSPLLFRQMVGRGTRIDPDVDNLKAALARGEEWLIQKKECILLDIVDSTTHHDLCTAATLAGFTKDAECSGESLAELRSKLDAHPQVGGVRKLKDIDVLIQEINLRRTDGQDAQSADLPYATLRWQKSIYLRNAYYLSMPRANSVLWIKKTILDAWRTSAREFPTLEEAVSYAESNLVEIRRRPHAQQEGEILI